MVNTAAATPLESPSLSLADDVNVWQDLLKSSVRRIRETNSNVIILADKRAGRTQLINKFYSKVTYQDIQPIESASAATVASQPTALSGASVLASQTTSNLSNSASASTSTSQQFHTNQDFVFDYSFFNIKYSREDKLGM